MDQAKSKGDDSACRVLPKLTKKKSSPFPKLKCPLRPKPNLQIMN